MRLLILALALALALATLASAAAASDPAPAPPSGLTITPSVTCRPGLHSETIILSTAHGDAIDATFVFCRDPSAPRESWIRNLARTRDRMVKATRDAAGKAAIRKAFNDRIAAERSAAY
ncbi:MAG TPA: hypothetical protein VK472_08115 [Allosphingosinicella sp.]|nr:hypothetical protein [Allosphingosinicella sp.]